MPQPLARQVVVITGASSGIGRETALLMAGRGASLVLAARNEAALQETARGVEQRGGQALVVPTDVADPEQVQRLADRAAAHFGRIDTWVNCAGVGAYGMIEDLTTDEMRRIVEVDLLGVMDGARAALPYLRQTRGTLINVSSVAGRRGVPLQGVYSAAKHGVVGFDEALRVELAHDDAGVSVTTILPYAIDTPFFEHARSRLGVLPRPTPPAYAPRDVAEAIARAAEHPAREIVVGGAAKGVLLMQRLSPALLDRMMSMGGLVFRMQKSSRPDDGVDNLFTPAPDAYRVRGAFGAETLPPNGVAGAVAAHPARSLAVAGGVLALLALIRRGGRDRSS